RGHGAARLHAAGRADRDAALEEQAADRTRAVEVPCDERRASGGSADLSRCAQPEPADDDTLASSARGGRGVERKHRAAWARRHERARARSLRSAAARSRATAALLD